MAKTNLKRAIKQEWWRMRYQIQTQLRPRLRFGHEPDQTELVSEANSS